MAIPYYPPSTGGGGANVVDATTEVKGIVRLATLEESTGNYQNLAVTPAGVQEAIAGIVGGMIFKGSYDVALATPALENAEQGDYYVISNVKVNPSDTNIHFDRFGQEWTVGDHLVIKEDMGGTIDDAKILKVDNTEKVAYLNDLLDVTEALASSGHVLIHDGVDYKNRELTPDDIVGIAQHLHALLDVSLNELTSASYTTSYAQTNLVHSNDYTVDVQGLDESQSPAVPYVKQMVLPSTLNDDRDEVRVVNIGDSDLQFVVSGSAVFDVGGNQSTTPIDVVGNREVSIVGEVKTYIEPDPQDPQQTIEVQKVAWTLSTGAVPSRMSLVRTGPNDWTSGFLTAADIVGVVTQGEREALQQELDRTQAGAGLNSDGTLTEFLGNFINGDVTLRQAILSLDGSLKTEQTARINADANLQSQITNEVSARQLGDTSLQNQINSLATIATTGASADASVTHTAVAYTPTAANVEAHIVQIDGVLNNVLSTNVLSVNGETPTLGDVALDGTHIDTTTTANNYTVAGASLDQHLDGIDTKLGSLQSDLNTEVTDRVDGDTNLQSQIDALATVATTGASADVSVAHTALSYTPTSADVEAHIVGLDTQVNLLGTQIVTDVNGEAPVNGSVTLGGEHIDSANTAVNYVANTADIDAHFTGVDTKLGELQTELDGTQVGAGLAADGSYSANAGANYIASATSLKEADDALDTAVGDIQAELDDTQAGAGLEADGSYLANALTSYLGSATSLKDADEKLDAQLALLGQTNVSTVNSQSPTSGNILLDGTHIDTTTTADNYTVTGASFDEHFDGIDTKLGDFQTEIDATQLGAGLAADGTYSANAGASFIASATSLKEADDALDAAVGSFQSELDATQAGAGLEADGSYIPPTAFVINLATSLKEADELLAGEVKLNSFKHSAELPFTYINSNQSSSDFNAFVNIVEADTSSALTIDLPDASSYINIGTVELFGVVNRSFYDVTLSLSTLEVVGTPTYQTYFGGELENDPSSQFNNTSTSFVVKARTSILFEVKQYNSGNINRTVYYPRKEALDAVTTTTPTAGDNSTLIATTAFVQTELANLSTTSGGTQYQIQVNDGSNGFTATDWEFNANNHLIPGANDTYDIGTAEKKVRDLYLGQNSLKFADDAVTPNVISVGLTASDHPLGENLVQTTDGVLPVIYRDLDDVAQGGNGYADIEDLANTNMLAKVASTGKYTDLTDTPQSVIVSSSFDTATQTYQLVAGRHHTYFPAAGDTITLVVPDSLVNSQTDGGDAIRITNWGNGHLKITTSGSSENTWLQYSQTLYQADTAQGATQPSIIIESRSTVDLYGWSYTSGGTTYSPAWGIYFSPSMEINTKSLTTTGEMLVYDATTDELKAGGLGDLSLTYAPTNYDNTRGSTVTGNAVVDHLGGIDDVLVSATDAVAGLVELATDAEAQAATATDRALTPSNLATLPLSTFDDVAYPSAPTDKQVLQWVNANSRWEPKTFAPAPPKVTSNAPGSTYSITTHEGIEEIYLLTPSVDCTVTIPSASTAGSGYKYYIKNLSTNTLTINATIDGQASFDLSVQYSAVTIVSDGTNWFII